MWYLTRRAPDFRDKGVRFEFRKSHNNSWPRWAIKAHNKHNTCRVEVAGIEQDGE